MKALIVHNPSSGQIWTQFKPEEAKAYLEEHGWQADIFLTDKPQGGLEAGKAVVAGGYDFVVVASGDGTINEVVQSIAGKDITLGIIPVGTTNVTARELGISSVKQALEVITQGEDAYIDLALVNDRYSIFVVGLGFDAQITRDVDPNIKHFTGIMAFAIAGPASFMKSKIGRVKIIITDHKGKKRKFKRRIFQLIVSNTGVYGSGIVISDTAKYDDGFMELYIYKAKRVWDNLWGVISFLLGKHREWIDTDVYKIKALEIKSKRKIPLQVDGEPYGTTPVKLKVLPNYLKIRRPKKD